MDTVTPDKRSWIMGRVKSKGGKSTELKIIIVLRKKGLKGWRRNFKLPGKPDFVYPKLRIAIFVDGCFWHGCPKCYKRPGTNQKFWDAKIFNNRKRDRLVSRELRRDNWTVVRIWQHQLVNSARVAGGVIRALK